MIENKLKSIIDDYEKLDISIKNFVKKVYEDAKKNDKWGMECYDKDINNLLNLIAINKFQDYEKTKTFFEWDLQYDKENKSNRYFVCKTFYKHIINELKNQQD